MVYEVFMVSFEFDSIDTLEIGDDVNIGRFTFSFIASSDSNATTYEYEGTVRLADKGADYVILHFDNLSCSCSFGDYVIDGYLNCPIVEEFEAEE